MCPSSCVVKRTREEKGISQLNLAMAIGHKSVGVISNCELCLQNKHFNIEQLIKIADVLDVNIKVFFENIWFLYLLFQEILE